MDQGEGVKLSKKAMLKQANMEKNQTGKWDKKFWYSCGALFLLFGGGAVQFVYMLSQFMGGKTGPSGYQTSDITMLDVAKDEAKLKDIFFGGQAHVLYCASEKTEDKPVPRIIGEIATKLAVQSGTETVQVQAANCFKKLTSGRTIAERFNFGKNEGFIGIFANGNKPVQLNYLPNAKNVAKQIKGYIAREIQKVVYLKDFDSCKTKKSCMILMGKQQNALARAQSLIKPSLDHYRKVQVNSVDTSFWDVNIDSAFKPETGFEEDAMYGAAICVVKDKAGDEEGASKEDKKKKPTYRAAVLKSWEGDAPLDFMKLCDEGGAADWTVVKDHAEVKAISSKPKIVVPPADAKAAFRKKQAEKEDAGLKKGGKERVGSLPEEKEEDLDEEDFVPEDEDLVEDVEL